jgi:5-methylcytosine-specific restriction enzyme subunit McrC
MNNNSSDIPKKHITETGIPIKNIWYMLLYALKAWKNIGRWHTEIENAPNIDSLFLAILADRIKQRMRIGLDRNYQNIGKEIYGIRGRIDFNESLKRLSFPHACSYSRFQLFLANIPKNQIIRSTLVRMIQIGNLGTNNKKAKEQRKELRKIVQEMDGIDIIELKPANIRREQLKNRDADYSLMLSLCYLLCLCYMPCEKAGYYSNLEIDRNNLILHNIYEKFVAEFYKHHLADWHVRPQSIIYWPAEKELSYLPVMKPDIMFQHKKTKKRIILDTKFTKSSIVTGQWKNETFNRDHLFQIYAYIKSQENKSEDYKNCAGILLYPTVNKHLHEKVNIQGHDVMWETIDLAKSWESIEKDLLIFINSLQEM